MGLLILTKKSLVIIPILSRLVQGLVFKIELTASCKFPYDPCFSLSCSATVQMTKNRLTLEWQ
jgi:hypothetical protein